MHGRSQSASESFNACRLGLEMVPLEASSSCLFLGQGELAGMLFHGTVFFKYSVGTLAQTLRQMINPADLHKYWCQSGWLRCNCGACVDLLDIQ